jgi:hypothetical protein
MPNLSIAKKRSNLKSLCLWNISIVSVYLLKHNSLSDCLHLSFAVLFVCFSFLYGGILLLYCHYTFFVCIFVDTRKKKYKRKSFHLCTVLKVFFFKLRKLTVLPENNSVSIIRVRLQKVTKRLGLWYFQLKMSG